MNRSTVIREVSLAFEVTEAQILSSVRTEKVCKARHAAFWLCRNKLNMTLEAIGSAFARDHSSVLHGLRRVPDYLAQDDLFLLEFYEAKKNIAPLLKADPEKVNALREQIGELLS